MIFQKDRDRVLFVFVAVVLAASWLWAGVPGASQPDLQAPTEPDQIRQTTVVVLETTPTIGSVQAVLTNLGVPFDVINNIDWTGIDFGPYDTVIVGMDGGEMTQASVQSVRAGVIDTGKRLCFFGGSAWQNFALGVNTSILAIDTVNYNWQVSTSPQFVLVDPTHPLAQGLPSSVDFNTNPAGYYMARMTDATMEVVAQNGDGFPSLIFKGTDFPGGGSGEFLWFTSSAADTYWTDSTDRAFLQQVISNFLGDPVPVELQSWSVE